MKRVLATVAIGCLTLAGCSSGEFKGVYDLPLPGGADLGDHPYSVTVQFADVLDLVPQAAVKVGDVPVGRVREVRLGGDGWTAETVVEVNGDVVLPANAVARLRQSSLLGEKFVELAPPDAAAKPAAAGRLANGATITLDRTNRNPEFEEIFGALSLLLNGGGIGQLQTINRELSKVMDGNEAQIRSFLSGVDTLMTDLDAHRSDITEALDGLNRLSATLEHRHEQVSGALTDLTPGLQALSEQRTQLVSMLQSLDRLSTVATDVVDRSRDDMVADLRALAPILGQLAAAGKNLPQSLQMLPTFPFPDSVLGAVKGDYINAYASMIPAPGVPLPPPGQGVPPGLPTLPLPSSGTRVSSGGS
ncbi:MCE family protein [Amycolatopsis vancoresmycina]|uniref:ABC transporter substrate-binding protein n=1 Tax=Amycolatopsis vancoresmycina DSM 44592 TaxID=1292037 RepID=R1HSJ6_9PSEU|nr:MCE family protein [Amycolatopsis vancoresmycina]EOD66520.1 ABC transporter substrate-binding protein [Amycolatopsis vancoresmycina DSM 44592]